MATQSADSSREHEVVSHINSLRHIGLSNIASEEAIRDVINDYFVSDVDFGETEEDEFEMEMPVPGPSQQAEPSDSGKDNKNSNNSNR